MLRWMVPEGASWRERGKSLAILVADIVGYSRLAGADEDRTLSRLRGLRSDLIDPAIDAHHGRIVKRTGDGNLIEFRSVVDAVRCAIEVQNGMAERNAGLAPERRIEFRVGIHLGDVVEESDGDLMGDGVNIAARLEGMCEPGAICLSEDAYRQVKGRLDLAVSDSAQNSSRTSQNRCGPIRLKSANRHRRNPGRGKAARAEKAHASCSPQRRDRRAGYSDRGRRLVYPRRRGSATVATKPTFEAARLSIVALPFANLSGDPATITSPTP